MDESLNNYGPVIESKIEAIKKSANTKSELEVIHREAKKLLNEYNDELERYSRFTDIFPTTSMESHNREHERLVTTLHTAIIQARSRLQEQQRRQTGSLSLEAGGGLIQRKTAVHGEDPAASLAREIGETLRNMSSTLQEEVLRSETSYSILESSSRRMKATNEQYVSFTGVIGTTKKLVKGLWARERTDRWTITMILAFFYTVLFYIAIKRLWLAHYLIPIAKYTFKSGWSIFLGIGSLLAKQNKIRPSVATTNVTLDNDSTIKAFTTIESNDTIHKEAPQFFTINDHNEDGYAQDANGDENENVDLNLDLADNDTATVETIKGLNVEL